MVGTITTNSSPLHVDKLILDYFLIEEHFWSLIENRTGNVIDSVRNTFNDVSLYDEQQDSSEDSQLEYELTTNAYNNAEELSKSLKEIKLLYEDPEVISLLPTKDVNKYLEKAQNLTDQLYDITSDTKFWDNALAKATVTR